MARIEVNEGSTSYHPLTIENKDGVTVTPEALRYRLLADDGTELVAWTSLSTSATEIEVSATHNTIGTSGKKRYLTVEATHSGGDKITEELTYTLVGLQGVAPST